MLLPVKYAKRLLTDFISTVYPRNCLNCTNILVTNESFLCTTCQLALPRTDFHNQPENLLYKNFAHHPVVTEAFAFLHFNVSGVAQHLLHALKYQNRPEIGRHFGRLYAKELIADRKTDWDIIIPVPMHQKKRRQRGYNQSEEVGHGMSEVLGIPVTTDIILKKQHTESQTKKGRLERWENVQNVFEVADPVALNGKNVLIVDDVITTGATTSAICDELTNYELQSITLCALATGVS